MRLLDLFCGQGGASEGYRRAGFEVTGIDISPMKRYPFTFYQFDVLALTPEYLAQFDAIHASPPCKVHTVLKAFSDPSHLNLIPETRDMLRRSGRPYVIENVPGAPLENPVQLCATSFGHNMLRHRLFEANWPLWGSKCRHDEQAKVSPGFIIRSNRRGEQVTPWLTVAGRGFGGGIGEVDRWRTEMDMDWASREGLREAIPPYYTEYIGQQLHDMLTKAYEK
jgi:DNA (cytosine-5)-methyltransferase 1